MRVAKTGKYDNSNDIIVKKFDKVEPFDRTVILPTPASEVKFIKKVEKIVRSSEEYKEFIKYLKEYIDMTYCSYFNGVTTKGSRKVSIHIHHEPFTLYDLVQIVMSKWQAQDKPLSHLLVAEEVCKIHYQGRTGLIPLSATVHSLVHSGKIFIPLQNLYGRYSEFVEEYGAYIPDEILEVLEVKVKKSRELTEEDTSILEKKFVYLEVDGMTFPQPIEED